MSTTFMNNAVPVTLDQLLFSREERRRKQNQLIDQYKCTLISFMVNMPGEYKDTQLSKAIHQEGMLLLENMLLERGIQVIYCQIEYKITGPEGYIVVDYLATDLKKLLMNLEDSIPIGRLFDFDVLDHDGNILSRTLYGHGRRKCLVCNEEAVICARTQKHGYSEIIMKMEEILSNYLGGDVGGSAFS